MKQSKSHVDGWLRLKNWRSIYEMSLTIFDLSCMSENVTKLDKIDSQLAT